ncbi:MAG: hypothetical protein ACOZNI_18385, partial [Myxococcota bacterium]
ERAGGVRGPRLTEPGFEKWTRIRRNLGWRDFITLLHDDLAEAFPLPFDLNRWTSPPLGDLDDAGAEALVNECAADDGADAHAFLRAAAKALGLPAGGALSELPRTQPHHKVLELPGAAGRAAAWQVLTQGGIAFHDQFVFVADTDEERALIGLAAVETRANPPTILTTTQVRDHAKRGQPFDRVVGIRGWAPAEALASQLGVEARWA